VLDGDGATLPMKITPGRRCGTERAAELGSRARLCRQFGLLMLVMLLTSFSKFKGESGRVVTWEEEYRLRPA
jgi:hypothetical protein